MKTAAVIAEYNPFHNGHLWQLEKVREAGATHIAVVMSPEFTQRGTPAIFPKRVRAQAALHNGADLVLELPVCYAAATAQKFAFGAVQTVCAMGCVDMLAFGAEEKELVLLQQAADALDDEDVSFALQQELKSGKTFAAAREAAVEKVLGQSAAQVLQKPNNILAVEYLQELKKCDWGKVPAPFVVERTGNVHDGLPVGEFASATYLRGRIEQGDWEEAKAYLPQDAQKLYEKAFQEGQTASLKQAERAVLYALRRMTLEQMKTLPDLSEGIENRLFHASRTACSLEELYSQIKTKRYPLSRVRRLVLAAFLGMPQTMQQETPPYLRVLGMNERGKELLSCMKSSAVLPVSTSLKKLSQTSDKAFRFASLQSNCADLYALLTQQVLPSGEDYRQSAVFL